MYRMVVGMIICLGVVIVTGCTTTQEQTADYVESGTSSVNQITRAIYASARAQVAGDLSVIDPYEQDFDTFRAQQSANFVAIRKEIEEQQLKLDGFLNAIVSVAATAVPGGSLAQGAAGIIMNRIQKTGDDANDAVDTAREEMKTLINNNKSEIGVADKRLTAVESTLDDVTTEGLTDIDLERAINQLSKEARELNEQLEDRVEQKRLEVVSYYDRMREMEATQAVAGERDRIMRDLHDGLGGQLVSTLSLIEGGRYDRDELAALLREALGELRFTIDSLDPESDDLLVALGMYRSRIESRLREQGLAALLGTHIALDGIGRAAITTDVLDHLPGFLIIGQIVDDDRSACPGECAGCRLTDTRTGSGDQGPLPCQGETGHDCSPVLGFKSCVG